MGLVEPRKTNDPSGSIHSRGKGHGQENLGWVEERAGVAEEVSSEGYPGGREGRGNCRQARRQEAEQQTRRHGRMPSKRVGTERQ